MVNILYSLQSINANSTTLKTYSRILSLSFSQKNWSEILDQLGYGEFWIMELSKVDIIGMDNVIKHLNKAKANLIHHSYEDCMTNIRSAWNAINPIINDKKDEIKELLDRENVEEISYDPKSKRIFDLLDRIKTFVQIGVHRENYESNFHDAQLSLYQSISMISYLSQMLKKIN